MSSEKPQGVDMLFPTAIKAVLRILEHNSIMACLVGELALNYYNVPDVVHVSLLPFSSPLTSFKLFPVVEPRLLIILF